MWHESTTALIRAFKTGKKALPYIMILEKSKVLWMILSELILAKKNTLIF